MTTNHLRRITDTRLLFVGIIGVILAAILTVQFAPKPTAPPFSVRSDKSTGAMVLWRWLERSGYDVRQLVSSTFAGDELDVLFVLNPGWPYTLIEAQEVREWVRQGNTLIVAGDANRVNSLLRPFDISLRYLPLQPLSQVLSSPTLIAPPVQQVTLSDLYEVRSSRDDLTMHLAVNGIPVLASFSEGAGTVWVSGSIRPFTNRGIQEADNASLILNLLSDDSPGSQIGFDEAQHGIDETAGQAESLVDWLTSSVPGWSILLAFGLAMAFVLLRGRRFGRPIPLQEDVLRREPVEYIQAMANLLRRSGQRQYTLRHYRTQFRRTLARRYAVAADLNAEDLSRAVAERDPAVDQAELYRLLAQLEQGRMSEQGLVSIALQIDDWIRIHH